MNEEQTSTAKPSWVLTLASIAVVIAALYLAKGVLIPLTLAVLLSFLLSPVCDWLERWRLSRIPAVLVTAILGFTVLGAMSWTAAVQTVNGPKSSLSATSIRWITGLSLSATFGTSANAVAWNRRRKCRRKRWPTCTAARTSFWRCSVMNSEIPLLRS